MKRTTFPYKSLWAGPACLALATVSVHAADISFTPPAGGGFVVKGPGNTERLRVQDSGEVRVPSLSGTANTNANVLPGSPPERQAPPVQQEQQARRA